jgi:plasmid stabilization system protein ParE
MSDAILLTELARGEIRGPRRWYRNLHPVLALDFARSIRSCLDRIAEFPGGHPLVHRGVRKAIPRRFPYLILYRSDGETITMIACLHAHRDPQSWMASLGSDDS